VVERLRLHSDHMPSAMRVAQREGAEIAAYIEQRAADPRLDPKRVLMRELCGKPEEVDGVGEVLLPMAIVSDVLADDIVARAHGHRIRGAIT